MPVSQPSNLLSQLLTPENAHLREDINGVSFHPPYLFGPHTLVILNPVTRILFFRRPTTDTPYCRIQVPMGIDYPADWLLECPGLGKEIPIETVRDFRAVLWLLVHGRAGELV